MNAEYGAADCYTHSREFLYEGYRFQVQINDDLMSYTATVSYDGEIVSVATDLSPEAAGWSHAILAEEVL